MGEEKRGGIINFFCCLGNHLNGGLMWEEEKKNRRWDCGERWVDGDFIYTLIQAVKFLGFFEDDHLVSSFGKLQVLEISKAPGSPTSPTYKIVTP